MATVKKKVVKAKAKAKAKVKQTVGNSNCITIRGLGNEGRGRVAAFKIDERGVITAKVGCKMTNGFFTLKSIMKMIEDKYGKKSPYYVMCHEAVKELRRQWRSKKFEGHSTYDPVLVYHNEASL